MLKTQYAMSSLSSDSNEYDGKKRQQKWLVLGIGAQRRKKEEKESDVCHKDRSTSDQCLFVLFGSRFDWAGVSIKGIRSKHAARLWEAKMASTEKSHMEYVCTYIHRLTRAGIGGNMIVGATK